MDLKEIMSVSGHSGLFKFVSQGRNGIIVESFADKKRMFVSASQKVSSLNDIAIFTEGEEVPLKEVFRKINELKPGEAAPDAKSSPEELKKFMESVLPEYDRNRVYISDIKKLVSWYNSLLEMNLLSFEEETPETPETSATQATTEAAAPAETIEETPAEAKEKTPAAPKEKKSPKKSAK